MPLTLLRHATQKPAGGPIKVDWGNPLTQGLAFALVLHDYGNDAPFEAINGLAMVRNGGATWGSSTNGAVMNLPSASTGYLITSTSPSDTPYLGGLTIVYRGRIDTGSNYRAFAGKCAANGATNNPFDFRTDNGSPQILSFVRADASSFKQFDSTTTVTLGVPQTYAVTTPDGLCTTSPSFYIDGVNAGSTTSGGTTPGAAVGSGQSITIGRRPDGAVQMDGACECVYIWSRALSAGEVAQVTAEPYGLFQTASRRWLFFPSGAAAPVQQMTEVNTTASQVAMMR